MIPEFTNHDVINLLHKEMEKYDLNQKELARKIGISNTYMNDMLHNRRDITSHVANYLGLKKVTIFRPK